MRGSTASTYADAVVPAQAGIQFSFVNCIG